MILLTGAGGFIGNHLFRHLKKEEREVLPLYHADEAEFLDDRWALDLANPAHLATAQKMSLPIDTVIHLAGHVDIALKANPENALLSPVPGDQNIPEIYRSNLSASANLLDFCLQTRVEHLIFASSQAVYGMPRTPLLTERTPCDPLEHYAASKLCCEKLFSVGAAQDMTVTVFRIPGVFSEHRSSGIIHQFCRSALRSKHIRVAARYPLPIDVIHLADLMAAFVKALKRNGKQFQCFNIGTGDPCSLDLLAGDIAQLVPGCRVQFGEIPQPVVHLDVQRATELLGWRSKSRQERFSSLMEHMRHAV